MEERHQMVSHNHKQISPTSKFSPWQVLSLGVALGFWQPGKLDIWNWMIQSIYQKPPSYSGLNKKEVRSLLFKKNLRLKTLWWLLRIPRTRSGTVFWSVIKDIQIFFMDQDGCKIASHSICIWSSRMKERNKLRRIPEVQHITVYSFIGST